MENRKFEEIAELWLADKKQYVKLSTYSAYSLIVENHLIHAFSGIDDVTEDMVQEFVIKRLNGGMCQKSVKDILMVLKMILRFASKRGYMHRRDIDVHFPTERDSKEIEVLTKSNQRILMSHIRNNLTFMNLGIYICLSAGLRIGEVCALVWDDIDMELGVINVSKTIQRIYVVEGEFRHTELVIDTPKSKNSMRQLPLTKELSSMIRPWKKVVKGSDFVLTNSEVPTEPRTYRNYYKRLMKHLNIPDLKFHGLRHSFATRCVESKCDYKTISVLLGHSNVSTTLNLYVHPDIEQKKQCVEQMLECLE